MHGGVWVDSVGMGSQEVVVPLLLELFDELLTGQRRAGFEPRAEEEELIAVCHEQIVDDAGCGVVVVGRPESVFEDHDRSIVAEDSGGTTEDTEFRSLDIELDENRMLIDVDDVVETSSIDVDQFHFFVGPIERPLPDTAVSGVRLDVMELERSGRSLDERCLSYLHGGEVDSQIGG